MDQNRVPRNKQAYTVIPSAEKASRFSSPPTGNTILTANDNSLGSTLSQIFLPVRGLWLAHIKTSP
jgi:hypothetical protein